MLENAAELRVATRNLRIMEGALQALRDQLHEDNPDLLATTEKAYVRRIESLQNEIVRYLYEHPTDISLILPPAELAAA